MKNKIQNKIKKIIIIYRDKEVFSQCEEVSSWLKERKVKSKFFSQSTLDNKTLKEQADLVLVLGGDGTYLRAVHFTQKKNIPILGINMGFLGFLTIHTKNKLYSYLEKTLNTEMDIVERSLLDIEIKRKAKPISRCIALNDVVIERGGTSKLINISVSLKKKIIYSIKADGLIISSATGSTAYNLAAGGPILHPKVKAFVVTPICPHILTHRPVIFPDNQTLMFKLENSVRGAYLTVDGKRVCYLNSSSHVSIKKAKQVHRTLRDPNHSEFLFLKDKFRFFEQ